MVIGLCRRRNLRARAARLYFSSYVRRHRIACIYARECALEDDYVKIVREDTSPYWDAATYHFQSDLSYHYLRVRKKKEKKK